MKQNINEIKKMQRIAGMITESEYQESMMSEETEVGINNDIEQDLMQGDFDSVEDKIAYLKDIIEFCQKKIQEISADN